MPAYSCVTITRIGENCVEILTNFENSAKVVGRTYPDSFSLFDRVADGDLDVVWGCTGLHGGWSGQGGATR